MTHVPNALTAEQWAELLEHTEQNYGGLDMLTAAYIFGESTVRYDAKQPHQLAAVALAALPDGDPRKLTWAMVEATETVLNGCRNFAPADPGDAALYGQVEALVAAVRSLLPPRPRAGEGG